MPRLLAARIEVDTIDRLERAAAERGKDASVLEEEGRSLAAIYLYGYEVEIRVKAACLRFHLDVHRLPRSTPLDYAFRNRVLSQYRSIGLHSKPKPHDILGWTHFLIHYRRHHNRGYDVTLEQSLDGQARRISRRWSEVLRYRANTPYRHELRSVREAVDWFRHYFKRL